MAMTSDDYKALRTKLEAERAAMQAELQQRVRDEMLASDDEMNTSRPLSRSDRLLIASGFTLADLAANDAWIEQERQRRDEAFAKRQHVPSTQDVVELPAFLPLLRTWDHPSEAERRRKKVK
ncbi:hypothetical protein ACVJGC_005477 [Bradyrhizobium diazoefficiens]